MSQVGELNVRIGADTAGLNKGLNEARGAVGGFNQSLGTTLSNLKTMHVAIAGTVAAITRFVSQTMEAVDAQAKLARQLGTTYESLATLNRIAELAGIQNLEGTLRIFNQRLSEAQEGAGPAADALSRLQLNAQELANLPVDDRIKKIGEQMMRFVPEAQQAAMAVQLFGRSGQQMLEILRDTGAIDKAAKDMRNLGLALNSVQTKEIESANDAMTIFGRVIEGVGTTIGATLAPHIDRIATQFKEMVVDSGFLRQALFVLAASIDVLVGFIRDLWNGLNYIPDAIGAIIGQVMKLIGMIPGLKGFGTVGQELVQNFNRTWEALGATGRAINGIGELRKKWMELKDEFKPEAIAPIGLSKEEIKALQGRLDAIKNSLMAESQLLDQKYQKDQKDLKDSLSNKLITEEEYNRALQALQIKHQEKLWEIEANSPEALRLQKLAENVIALENSLLTEEELLIADYEKKHQMLRDFYTVQGEITAEGKALLEKLEIDHQQKLNKVREKGMTDMMRFAEQARRGDYKDALGTLQKMTAATAGANKDMFNMNKAATLAEAVLDAYKAITGAYRWGVSKGGPPLGAAMAAAAGAFQFAQIRAIASQQYNGAGSTAPSVAAATPAGATPVTSVGGGGGGGDGGQTVTINLTGEIFGREQVRNLITQINEAISDGSTLRLT